MSKFHKSDSEFELVEDGRVSTNSVDSPRATIHNSATIQQQLLEALRPTTQGPGATRGTNTDYAKSALSWEEIAARRDIENSELRDFSRAIFDFTSKQHSFLQELFRRLWLEAKEETAKEKKMRMTFKESADLSESLKQKNASLEECCHKLQCDYDAELQLRQTLEERLRDLDGNDYKAALEKAKKQLIDADEQYQVNCRVNEQMQKATDREIETLKNQLEATRAEVLHFRTECESYKSEAQAMEMRTEEHVKSLTESSQKFEALVVQHEHQSQRIKELEELLEKETLKSLSTAEERLESSSRFEELSNSLQEERAKIETLNVDHEHQSQRIKELEELLEKETLKSVSMEEERRESSSRFEELSSSLQGERAKVKELEDLLEKETLKSVSMEDERSASSSRIEELSSSLEGERAKYEALKSQHENQSQRVKELEGLLEEKSVMLMSMEEERREDSSRFEKLSSALEEERAKADKDRMCLISEREKSFNAEISSLRELNESLLADLQRLSVQHVGMQENLEQATKELILAEQREKQKDGEIGYLNELNTDYLKHVKQLVERNYQLQALNSEEDTKPCCPNSSTNQTSSDLDAQLKNSRTGYFSNELNPRLVVAYKTEGGKPKKLAVPKDYTRRRLETTIRERITESPGKQLTITVLSRSGERILMDDRSTLHEWYTEHSTDGKLSLEIGFE